MVRIKISSIKQLATSALCDKVSSVTGLLVNSVIWPNPQPTLQTLNDANAILRQLEIDSESRDRSVIAEKRAAKAALIQLFLDLCLYLAYEVRNKPDAADLITGLGLEMAQPGGGHPVGTLPVPDDVRSKVSQEPGAVDLQWQVATERGVHSFIIEMCEGSDPVAGIWRQVASSSTQKHTVGGLMRGKYYSFRVRCLGAKSSVSEPSEVTTCLAA